MATTPPDGIYEGIPFDDYLAWDAVSSSKLRGGKRRTILHARYASEQDDETDAMKKGSLAHCLALEGIQAAEARFIREPEELLDDPSYKNPRQGKPYQQWKAAQDGPIVKREDWQAACLMVEQVYQHKSASRLLMAPGMREVSLITTDEATGLRLKARLDLLTRGQSGRPMVIDIKSAREASRPKFTRAVFDQGYHMQSEFYARVVRALTGENPSVGFVVIENAAPFACATYDMTEWLGVGRFENDIWLRRWAAAVKSNHWPGYPGTFEMLPCPQWVDHELERVASENQEWVA